MGRRWPGGVEWTVEQASFPHWRVLDEIYAARDCGLVPYLIDGYNLMHAKGLLGKGMPSQQFARRRARFLDMVAEALGPFEAARATVVFDAGEPHSGRSECTTHRGMTVLYAVGDEDADARIEELLRREPNPGGLTVVSSDRRVRVAASRRGAKSVDSDAFWFAAMEGRGARPVRAGLPDAEAGVELPLSKAERDAWVGRFADADAELCAQSDLPGMHEGLLPSAAELRAIEREVREEDLGW